MRGRVLRYIGLFYIGLFCALGGSRLVPMAEAQPPSASPESGVYVTLDGQKLFRLWTNLGPYRPAERAKIVEARLQRLAESPNFRLDTLGTQEEQDSTHVVAGGIALVTVTDREASVLGRSRQSVAAEYVEILREALHRYREERSLKRVFLGALYSLLATVTLVAALALLNRLCSLLRAKVLAWHNLRLPGVRVQNTHLLRPVSQLTGMLLWQLGALRLAVTALLLYLYLALVFGFFPWTRGYAETLLGAVAAQLQAAGNSFLAQLPNLLFILIILLVTRYILKAIRFFFNEVSKGTILVAGLDRELADPTYKIVRFLVLALAAVAILPYIPGYQSPAFQGISVFLGVLFSLGSTSAVANMVAGIVLTYMRPFKVGDRVKIAETSGDVVEKTLLVTRIRTTKNVDVTLPNATILNAHIINYSRQAREGGLILHTTVTIGYDTPWRQTHELLIAAARATEGVLAEPPPFVLQTALNDFAVSYELNAYTDQPHRMAAIYSELHQHIQDSFFAADVEILSPQYVSLRDGNARALPSKNTLADRSASSAPSAAPSAPPPAS
jgi:small-conductance mechanosensitive channel